MRQKFLILVVVYKTQTKITQYFQQTFKIIFCNFRDFDYSKEISDTLVKTRNYFLKIINHQYILSSGTLKVTVRLKLEHL